MIRFIRQLVCVILTVVFVLPLAMTGVSSLMCNEELGVIYSNGVKFRWIPYEITLQGYWRVIFESQAFLATFWNSMLIAVSSAILQVIISLIVGYSFVRANCRGKRVLLGLYMVIMLTPFQVTLLPNYLMAKELRIFNSWWALILPNSFAPLGVFLMHEFIKDMPGEICEAAYLDTSSNWCIIGSVILPNVRAGVMTVAILSFVESWNMVEQPLVLLEDEWLYPLSLRLSALPMSALDMHFSGAVLYMIPSILLYALFRDELIEGVQRIKM